MSKSIKIYPKGGGPSSKQKTQWKSTPNHNESNNEATGDSAYHYEYHGEYIMQNGQFYENPDFKAKGPTHTPNDYEYSDQHHQQEGTWSDPHAHHGDHRHYYFTDDDNDYYYDSEGNYCYYGNNQPHQQQPHQYHDHYASYTNSAQAVGGNTTYSGYSSKTRANTWDDEMPTLHATDLEINLSQSGKTIRKSQASRPLSAKSPNYAKKTHKKAHEVNPKRINAIEIALGLPETNRKRKQSSLKEDSDPVPSSQRPSYSPSIILAAMRRGFAQEKFLTLLIFTLIRWMLLILLFIYLMHYLASTSCRSDETCRGRLKSLASFNCFVMILHIMLGHRILRLSTTFTSVPIQVQQYVKEMCVEPPVISFRVTCYRHFTVEEMEVSKITLHTDSAVFWHEGFTDNTNIPEGIAQVVSNGTVPTAAYSATAVSSENQYVVEDNSREEEVDNNLSLSNIPCELFKIHGTIEYTFRDHMIQSEFAHDQQRFINKHAHCDRQRKIEITVTGPDFETRKVCCRDSQSISWFIRYRFLVNFFFCILSVNWLFVVFLEGLTAHFNIVFEKDIVH